MTLEKILELNLLEKMIFKKVDEKKYISIFISGIVKQNDTYYFVTDSTTRNSSKESVVRLIKVSFIKKGLASGLYKTQLSTEEELVEKNFEFDSVHNSFYSEAYDLGWNEGYESSHYVR